MSVNIGPKIGINGEAKYRAEINKIIQQGKTLSAQMKAVSSAYQNADNKEQALADVTKTLGDQIKNQRLIVEKFADAVAKSSAQTGENSTETLKWKEQLAKAERELNELEGTTAEAVVGVEDLGEAEHTAGNEAEKSSDHITAFAVALGNLMSDAIKEGISWLANGLAEIGKAAFELTKKSVKAFSELEQNIGGSEAVFGSYAESIQKTGEQAYKTMGATQSEYLATANKMGALFQGSGLNAQRSAELTTQAMQRAADMASVMGIETSDALEAITGAAKGNYTMMDNLGVAMNATTLEAYALDKGFDTAFSKMSNAEKAELAMQYFFERTTQYAGNFEREASETIAGSIGTLTAAVETWVAGLGNAEADITQLTQNILLAFEDVVSNVLPVVKNIISVLPMALNEFAPVVFEIIGELAQQIPAIFNEDFVNSISKLIVQISDGLLSVLPQFLTIGISVVQNLLTGINENSWEIGSTASALIMTFASFIIENLPLIVETATNIIIAFVEGLDLSKLVPAAIQMIITIADNLLSHVGEIIAVALQLIDGLIEGLTGGDGLNQIIAAVPKLIFALVDGILSNLDKIIASGMNIIVNLVMGLIQAIPQLVMMTPKIINAIVTALRSFDWSSLGKNIISNISEGARANATAMVNGVKKALETAINWLKNLGGQALAWGKDMITGFGNGIRAAAEQVVAKVRSLADKIRGFLHFSRPDFGPLRDYEQWMPDFMKGLAQGINQNAWRVDDALKNVSTDMTIAAEPMYGANAQRSQNTMNLGGMTINVYAQPGQDVDELANVIMQKMQSAVVRREAVFA